MNSTLGQAISRRSFLQTTAMASAALSFGPYFSFGNVNVLKPMKRSMGRLDFEATTLGMGGQASLQWTPPGVDPVKILLKAYELGINYFDTSNAYGPSQANYGKAFRELHLVAGQPGYREAQRRAIFLTSKTGLRWAKGGPEEDDVRSFTNGPEGSHTIDDVKRSLTLIFGDGRGYYPPGAYLDMVLLHSMSSMAEVDAVYEGLDRPDANAENIGALAALLDYRDGTNLTGLNPKGEKLLRHIGFSGHHSPSVNMEMIQRDDRNILDAMLVAINANDRQNFNMQYNVIPVAAAKNMGLIAMKTFADGAMYGKEARFSHAPEDVIHTVGGAGLPSRRLVEYTLTTPGMHTAIIGTGHIDSNAGDCQLKQNLSAAQISPNGLSLTERREIEALAATAKSGMTNYFQLPKQLLTPPISPSVQEEMQGDQRVAHLEWQTAFAGDEPIAHYEIWRDQQKVSEVPHSPQVSKKKPFAFNEVIADTATHHYQVRSVDAAGRFASSQKLVLWKVA